MVYRPEAQTPVQQVRPSAISHPQAADDPQNCRGLDTTASEMDVHTTFCHARLQSQSRCGSGKHEWHVLRLSYCVCTKQSSMAHSEGWARVDRKLLILPLSAFASGTKWNQVDNGSSHCSCPRSVAKASSNGIQDSSMLSGNAACWHLKA